MGNLHTLSIQVVIPSFLVFLIAACGQHNASLSEMKKDHEAVKKILDAALLSERPLEALRDSLEKVRTFTSVDSAWISGVTLFVRYKEGSTVSWTAPPEIK